MVKILYFKKEGNYMSELYHHGIKGQKWGVRRYQNADGTLTSAGKKRYYNDLRKANDASIHMKKGYGYSIEKMRNNEYSKIMFEDPDIRKAYDKCKKVSKEYNNALHVLEKRNNEGKEPTASEIKKYNETAAKSRKAYADYGQSIANYFKDAKINMLSDNNKNNLRFAMDIIDSLQNEK